MQQEYDYKKYLHLPHRPGGFLAEPGPVIELTGGPTSLVAADVAHGRGLSSRIGVLTFGNGETHTIPMYRRPYGSQGDMVAVSSQDDMVAVRRKAVEIGLRAAEDGRIDLPKLIKEDMLSVGQFVVDRLGACICHELGGRGENGKEIVEALKGELHYRVTRNYDNIQVWFHRGTELEVLRRIDAPVPTLREDGELRQAVERQIDERLAEFLGPDRRLPPIHLRKLRFRNHSQPRHDPGESDAERGRG